MGYILIEYVDVVDGVTQTKSTKVFVPDNLASLPIVEALTSESEEANKNRKVPRKRIKL